MTTAAILAGGKSSRMGTDKLALTYGGGSLLSSAVTRFQDAFDEVILCVSETSAYPEIKAVKTADIFKNCGPMGGLHSALLAANGGGVFLAAADMPFSNPSAAKKIISLCGDCDICVLKDVQGRYEPLFAYYKKSLIPHCEKALSEGCYKMLSLFDRCAVRELTHTDLCEDYDTRMFLNVNRPEDYEKLIKYGGSI